MEPVFWYKGHKILIDDVIKAKGLYICDSRGGRYMDMESGVWCTPLGHGCKSVQDALIAQIKDCIHTGYAYTAPIVGRSAEKLLKLTGLTGGKCMFLSSGSEAVETGAQIIKKISDRKLLMTFSDSFLGSHGTVCAKDEGWYLFGWEGCENCSSGACTECPHFKEIPFDDIAGFIFEPGSSSGLVRFPPDGLVKEISAEIKKRGGFVMANEITTGTGRTGMMFGYEHYGLQPDIVAIGKGIGNGYPVSCVTMSADVAERADSAGFKAAQSHQNDPSGAAAALAVISEIESRDLLRHCKDAGNYFISRLGELKDRYEIIDDIRGRGLMISVTFKGLSDSEVYDIFMGLFAGGYILVKRPGLPVFRLDPPLIITQTDIDGFLEVFERILKEKGY